MNNSLRFYGKSPLVGIEMEVLLIKDRYRLNDMQVAGLLRIHDFFKRVTLFDCSPYSLELVQYRYGAESGKQDEMSRGKLPFNTLKFFDDAYTKCSDGRKHFADDGAHKYFKRFAEKVLSNINNLSDYVGLGVIEQIDIGAVQVVEFRG